MKRLVLFLLAALMSSGERIVLKDNSVRIGRLTGIEGGNLVVDGSQRIPIASVAAILFEDSAPGFSSSPISSGTGVSSQARGFDPVAPVAASNVQTVGTLRVELMRCTKQGVSAVTCEMRVTNTGPDRAIGLYGNTSVYVDASGAEKRGVMAVLGAAEGRGYATTTMVTNVPVSASVRLPGVANGVNSLAKLNFRWLDNRRQVETEFRNVPLQGN